MRNYFIIYCISALLFSCGGKLTDEQRKAIKEERENREIKQVRDSDIVNQALVLGRKIQQDPLQVTNYKAEIKTYNSLPDEPILQDIWEAYVGAIENGIKPEENIQRDYPARLIYTYPELTDTTFMMHAIFLPKQQVVLSLE